MAFWSSFGLSNGMAAAGAAATVAVAGFVGFQFLGEADGPAPDITQPAAETTELAALPEQPVPAPELADPTLPTPDPVVQTDPAAPIPPSFDLVRVDAAGGAVIAGRAAANAALRLRLDGQEIYNANSDGTGSFVAMLSIPPSDLPQVLSLEMVLAGGEVLASDQSVIIQPAAREAVDPAPDASPELPDPDMGLPTLAATTDAAPAGGTVDAPQLGVPEAPGTPPATELAMLEAELPDASPADSTNADPAPAPTGALDETSPEVAASAPGSVAGPQEDGSAPELPATDTTAIPQSEPLAPSEAQDETAVAAADAEVAAPAATAAPLAGIAPDETGTAGMVPAPETPASPPQDTAEPQVPTVMIADAQGIRVVQAAGPEPQVQVVLDTISYDTTGEVVLTGRGPAQSDVRLYLDNQPVQLARINTAGGWSTQLPQVDPGTYTLRLDEVSAEGSVLSRVETPFLREEPATLEALPQRDGVSVITVQPGHTLWGIAREQLGEGVLYVQVYEANRDQIRDPHWIYPGQIFAIPDALRGQ